MTLSADRVRELVSVPRSCQTSRGGKDLDQRVDPKPSQRDRSRGDRRDRQHRASDHVSPERRAFQPQPAPKQPLPLSGATPLARLDALGSEPSVTHELIVPFEKRDGKLSRYTVT